jgi:hypothetical protein
MFDVCDVSLLRTCLDSSVCVFGGLFNCVGWNTSVVGNALLYVRQVLETIRDILC